MLEENGITTWGLKEVVLIQFLLLIFRHISMLTAATIFPNAVDISSFIGTLFFTTGRLMLIPLILYYVIIVYEQDPWFVGLRLGGTGPYLRFTIRIGILLVILLILGINIPHSTGRASFKEVTPLIEVSSLSGLSESLLYFTLIFTFYITAVFAEELFYRGFLFSFIKWRTGLISGVFFNSLAFSLFQPGFSRPAVLAYFILGIICTVVCQTSRSILPGVVFRTFIQAGVTVYATGWIMW